MSDRSALRRWWDSLPALPRDLGAAVLFIAVLMGVLWGFTGQPLSQAPLVVVESGSMMHDEPPFGRVGTIDPGDLILVKEPDLDPRDVVTMYGARAATPDAHPGEGGRSGYGETGDVIIYRQDACPRQLSTPIIHRAVTWVEVESVGGEKVFSYHDANGVWQHRRSSVDLPEIRLNDASDFTQSGWVTKGDNPRTNAAADQIGVCEGLLVKPEWLVGKARGEIPWVGLLKFIVQGNTVSVVDSDWCTVGRAKAPCDTFTMLWISLAVVVMVPLAWDLVLRLRARGDDDEPEPLHNAPPYHPAAPPERPLHHPHRDPLAPPSRHDPAQARQPPREDRGTGGAPRWSRRSEDER